MQRLKSVFKDTNGLYSRIDCFTRQSPILRIGLIPVKSREASSTILNAMIDDPIQSTVWSEVVANRILTKDVLVTQSPSFEFVETHNSQVVYPVPFNGPALEYLEVSSARDSWDHLKSCPLHLYLTDEPGRGPNRASDYPHLVVVDSKKATKLGGSHDVLSYSGEEVFVDSRGTLQANELLRESPSNSSRFLELRKQSKIEDLKATFDVPKVYEALKSSIIRSCKSQISDLDFAQSQAKPSMNWAIEKRQRWSERAHRELQSSYLPRLRHALYSELAFYKLFLRADDVDSTVSHVSEHSLPKSQAEFQYLKGRLSQANAEVDSQATTSPGFQTNGPSLSDRSADSLSVMATSLVAESMKLQNKALLSVLSCLGIQLPVAAVSVAGVFMGGYSWFSMGALLSLGVITGLRKLQGDWLGAAAKYEQAAHHEAVRAIAEAEQQLWNIGEKSTEDAAFQRREMQRVLDEALSVNP